MTFNALVALVSAVWLLSCGVSALALYWNVFARGQRWGAAIAASCVALVIAYGGLSQFRLSASKTVNGHIEWSVDSRWFFIAALIFAGAALALSLWNWWRSRKAAAAANRTRPAAFCIGSGLTRRRGPLS